MKADSEVRGLREQDGGIHVIVDHRFDEGDYVFNKILNEDARVLSCHRKRGIALYLVRLSTDRGGWKDGRTIVEWKDWDLEGS